jgi:hypothetical protein
MLILTRTRGVFGSVSVDLRDQHFARDLSGGEPSRFLLAFIAGDEKTAVAPLPGQKVEEKMVT